jgi:hypothetical protein
MMMDVSVRISCSMALIKNRSSWTPFVMDRKIGKKEVLMTRANMYASAHA